MVVFVIGDKEVNVPYQQAIQSRLVKHRLEQNPNIVIVIPYEYSDVIGNYIDYLTGEPGKITTVGELKHCFEMETLFDNKHYFVYLMSQAYNIWNEFYPLIASFPEDKQKEIYLHTPYEFVPNDLISKQLFFDAWLEINKNTIVTLNGNEQFHTDFKYYPNSGTKTCDIYHTVNGKKVGHGWFRAWYSNGSSTEGKLFNGIRQGLWMTWYDNDRLASEDEYDNDHNNGLSKAWYKNGKLSYEGKYVNDKKQGLWKFWFENGQPFLEGMYINDKQEGKWKMWHSTGELESETEYVNGNKQGLEIGWNKNGQPTYEVQHKYQPMRDRVFEPYEPYEPFDHDELSGGQ